MEPARAEARGYLFLRPFGAKIPTDSSAACPSTSLGMVRGILSAVEPKAAVLERWDKFLPKLNNLLAPLSTA
jgi:hypothetical protein